MSEQQDKAADLEQRYVAEYQETEDLVEGLDPEASEGSGTAGTVEAVAPDAKTEDEVDRMSREG